MSSPGLRFAVGMVRLATDRLRILGDHVRAVLEEMEELAGEPDQVWQEWAEEFRWLVDHQIERLYWAAWLAGARAHLQVHFQIYL